MRTTLNVKFRAQIEVYYSFRSPYSYLALQRIFDWFKQDSVDLVVRPVMPMAVINPKFFTEANPLMVPYVQRDVERIAKFEKIPFAWPNPDPIVMEYDPVNIAAEQPYIHRLTRLAVEAGRKGRSLEFTHEVATMLWSGVVENWLEGTHLADAVDRAGLNLAEMDAAIEADPESYITAIEENHTAREAAGHWGSPCIVIDGEPFFGQDRIELAKWRYAQM